MLRQIFHILFHSSFVFERLQKATAEPALGITLAERQALHDFIKMNVLFPIPHPDILSSLCGASELRNCIATVLHAAHISSSLLLFPHDCYHTSCRLALCAEECVRLSSFTYYLLSLPTPRGVSIGGTWVSITNPLYPLKPRQTQHNKNKKKGMKQNNRLISTCLPLELKRVGGKTK